MEVVLPRLEDIRRYATKRGLKSHDSDDTSSTILDDYLGNDATERDTNGTTLVPLTRDTEPVKDDLEVLALGPQIDKQPTAFELRAAIQKMQNVSS